MRGYVAAFSLVAMGAGFVHGKGVVGDSKRGAELIRSQGCVSCHRIGNEGGTMGPDLGKARGRNYTPASMASAMWNHAPAMWSKMDAMGAEKPRISDQQAGDLFAYFQSIRYFDKPGDAARGKRVFDARRCAECHGRTAAMAGGAPPIAAWSGVSTPIVFAQQMWNHFPRMQAAMESRKIKWTELTTEELTDILVYVQGLPEARGKARVFALEDGARGESLFAEKGCQGCHQGNLDLAKRHVNGTVTDFAVAMWNHAPAMAAEAKKSGKPFPQLEAGEMRELVSFLWNRQIYGESGDAGKGQRVFAKRNCAKCHMEGGEGPNLKAAMTRRGEPVQVTTMMSVLWKHGPRMLREMQSKQIAWPVLSEADMQDLVAYLNTLPGRAKAD